MSRLFVRCFGVSVDGFSAGPNQSIDHPLGVNGEDIMGWFFPTKTFRSMQGMPEGETGVDDRMAAKGFDGIGAWILGRNMFGPVRGAWPDESWRGWWGEEPPYHMPVFVLTHHPRPPLEMKGGTTFHFVTDGIQSALAQAKAAAGERDVCVGGGASTVRQYLQAKLIDELHLAVRPVLMGAGEELFHGIDLRSLGYRIVEHVAGERAMHVIIRKD